MIRPSSLPALAQCPKFEGGSSEFALEGTNRHRVLSEIWNGNTDALNKLPEDQRDGVQWAVDYIRLHAPLSDYLINFEARGVFITDDFDEVPGSIDAECGPVIFDLKWRMRDYGAQMAAYALIKLARQKWDQIEIRVLFAESQTAQVYKLTEDEARAVVEPIIKRAKDTNATEKPCDYCGWCAKRLSCPALNAMAQTVANGREDWKLEQYHASEIAQPEQMAKALTLARHLKQWIKGVEHFAKEMVIKQGVAIPGHELKERKGKRQCTDLNGVFNALGLAPEQFLQCCDIRWRTNTKTPDRPGIENVYAKANGLALAAATRQLKRTLEPYITTSKPSQSLVPIKSENEIEEGEE